GDAGAAGNGGSAGSGGSGSTIPLTPVVWAKSAGSVVEDYVAMLAVDPAGHLLVGGRTGQTIDWGNGPLPPKGSFDVFLAQLDPSNGSSLWSRRFGGAGMEDALDVAADSQGNAILAAHFIDTADFGGSPLVAIGTGGDTAVAKYDANGMHLWSKGVGPSRVNAQVATDAAGNVILVTSCSGTNDFGGGPLTGNPGDLCVAKFDPSGAHSWSKRFKPNNGSASGTGLAVDTQGAIILCGTVMGAINFGGDQIGGGASRAALLVKLGPDGSHIWSKSFSSTSEMAFLSLALDAADKIIVAGFFMGTADVGGGPLTAAMHGPQVPVPPYDNAGSYIYRRPCPSRRRLTAVAIRSADRPARTQSSPPPPP
ncbi:MAG TPA: hypothetical protein PK156_06640, partial [Polyangium sp.]|nr:hypothetical protein [Polyangium sp.]